MSKTGRYKMVDGKFTKVSDETPRIASRIDGVYFREPYLERFNGREPQWIHSKGEKKAEMARRGIREFEESAEDVKQEKTGTIYSYNGQPNRTSSVKPEPKVPARFKHLAI